MYTRVDQGIETTGNMILNRSRGVNSTKFAIKKWKAAKVIGCEVL
jgi:hypothetical protein